jgi:hypothetical protein
MKCLYADSALRACGIVMRTKKKDFVGKLKAVDTLGKFILDILVATLLFLVIAAVAVGLSVIVKKLIEFNIAPLFITNSLTVIEYFLFAVDSILFLLYVARNSVDLAKEILKK